MTSALLERSASPRLASLDELPVSWRPSADATSGLRIAVTVGLSGAVDSMPGALAREVLIWIDLPSDANVRGAGIDVLARETWCDEMLGNEFEHITCQVRHEAATNQLDLMRVLNNLRDQGLITDGDRLESVELSTCPH